MNRRLGGDASLNAQVRADGEGEWQDWLVDESDNQEDGLVAERGEPPCATALLTDAPWTSSTTANAASSKPARLQDDPATLEDLSQEFGVSRERIRQIEVRAFEKVQKAVKNAAQRLLAPKTLPSAGAPA